MTTLKVNGRTVSVAAEPDKPLLWVLREDLSQSEFHQAVQQWAAMGAACPR